MKHHVTGAIFNLDGVVADTAAYHVRAWKKTLAEKGWQAGDELLASLKDLPRLACVERVAQANGLSLDDSDKHAVSSLKNACFIDAVCSMRAQDLRPGVVDFIGRLKRQGVKCGLTTLSTNAGIIIDRLGLKNLFDAIVTGSDIRRPKPDPEIFTLCAKRMDRPAHHCIVFDDTALGVEAALAARMKVIGMGNGPDAAAAPEQIGGFAGIDIDCLLDTGRTTHPPYEPWNVTQTDVRARRSRYWETLFALTNGYLGLRGTFEEEDPAIDRFSYPGMFVNRVCGYKPWNHVEYFPGFSTHLHVMLNLADWRIVNIHADGAVFSPVGRRRKLPAHP